MNETKEMIKKANGIGFTTKCIAIQSGINVNTLYAFTSGYRNLSKEKENRVIATLVRMGVID